MRFRHAFVFLAIALVSASAASDEPIVALSVEPEVTAPAPTLEDAARANDYATFDALYRANPDPAYRALHELWTYAMTDRVGAFYGAEMYARLSREYPAYAEYIAHYRIVDGKGETFYPASETRAFLLENRTAGTEQIAERRLPAGRSAGILPAVRARQDKPAGSRRSGRQDGGAPQAVAPQAVAPRTVAPPTIAPRTVAPVKPVTQPTPTPVEDLALLNTVTTAPAPVPVPAPAPATTQTSAPAAPKSTNRGLLLIILGLAGVGLLALILRAPREVIP